MHRYYFRSSEQMHHTGVKRGCGAWCMGYTLHVLFPFFCKLEIALKIFIEEKKKRCCREVWAHVAPFLVTQSAEFSGHTVWAGVCPPHCPGWPYPATPPPPPELLLDAQQQSQPLLEPADLCSHDLPGAPLPQPPQPSSLRRKGVGKSSTIISLLVDSLTRTPLARPWAPAQDTLM